MSTVVLVLVAIVPLMTASGMNPITCCVHYIQEMLQYNAIMVHNN